MLGPTDAPLKAEEKGADGEWDRENIQPSLRMEDSKRAERCEKNTTQSQSHRNEVPTTHKMKMANAIVVSGARHQGKLADHKVNFVNVVSCICSRSSCSVHKAASYGSNRT